MMGAVRLVLTAVFIAAVVPAAAIAIVVEGYLRLIRWLAGR